MLAPKRASDKMGREFQHMQRALFIIWLGKGDRHLHHELEESAAATARGEGSDWNEVRREMDAKFDV